MLHEANKKNEETAETYDVEVSIDDSGPDECEIDSTPKVDYLSQLPFELRAMVVKMLGVKAFYKLQIVCK